MLATIHFLHPEFLYGLFILCIPIILHFFSFKKYKKVYFSNFTFLQALQQQRKNSSKLKNFLLLALRLLALASIVIAFAYPYFTPRLSETAPKEKPQIIIYIDNSFSMSNMGAHGSLLEEAKKHLFDILNTYPLGTRFMLLTNDHNSVPALNRDEIINQMAALKTTSSIKKLSEIFKECREISGENPATLFLLSDFQQINCDFQQIKPDTLTHPVFLMLQPENTNNLYIQDVTFGQLFHQKNRNDQIHITLVNTADKEYTNVPVNLTINGKKKSVSKANLSPQSTYNLQLNYLNNENGFYKGLIEITDFPVLFDNKFYFSYKVDNQIPVLCIEQDRHLPFFGKLFADSTTFNLEYKKIQQTANLNFKTYKLIILDRISTSSSGLESALENYLKEGGNLLILPGPQSSVNQLNHFLKKLQAPVYSQADSNLIISDIEKQSSLFKDVFEKQEANSILPRASVFYQIATTPKTEKLLNDNRNNTALAAQQIGQGNLYLSAFDFDPSNSDLVYHPLFVPMMVNMAYNFNKNINNSWFLHSDQPLHINSKETNEGDRLIVRKDDQSIEFIPEIRKDFSGNQVLVNTQNLEEAGLYEVLKNEKVIDVFACNYDRNESRMQFCKASELQKYFPEAKVENLRTTQFDRNSELIKEIVLQDNNKYLSRWFILLAIAALLLEQLVWKKKLQ